MATTPSARVQPDDEELVRRSVDDPDAFEVLVGRYRARIVIVIRGCIRSHGNGADAEDLTQETFLRFFNVRQQYLDGQQKIQPDQRSFSAYLFKVAKNVATDYLRKKGRSLEVPEHELAFTEEPEWPNRLDLAPDTEALQETRLIEYENREMVRSCLSELVGRRRDYLFLHWYEGMTQTQIAEHFGVTPPTVKVVMDRAVNSLRRCVAAKLSLRVRKAQS